MAGKHIAERVREWLERFRGLLESEEPFEEVFVTYDPTEAEMMKDVLESGGMKVVLRSSKVTPFPVNVGKAGEIKILVPGSESHAAKKVIEALQKIP